MIAAVDRLLDPYGGLGAHGRDLQVSNSFIDAELQQLQSTAWVLPPVFFLVAAFLVNMVIGRIVELERAEIGLLKALGYRDRAVSGTLSAAGRADRADGHRDRLDRGQLAGRARPPPCTPPSSTFRS